MKHTYELQVFYEDVDLGGIVYHSKYLNFCERARSDIFFKQGKSPVIGDTHFVVKHLNADFIASGSFEERLRVETEVLEIKKASLQLAQKVYNTSTDSLLFSMVIDLVCMKGTRISKIPTEMLEVFQGATHA